MTTVSEELLERRLVQLKKIDEKYIISLDEESGIAKEPSLSDELVRRPKDELVIIAGELKIDRSRIDLFAKSTDDLAMIGEESNIFPPSPDVQGLVHLIQIMVMKRCGYRMIEGRLEILADGFGFLREVHLYDIDHNGLKWLSPEPYDGYDVYVPDTVIRRFNLHQDDAIAGLRRWPYSGDGEQYFVLIKIYEINQQPQASRL
jgi:transcription termination factor Rho